MITYYRSLLPSKKPYKIIYTLSLDGNQGPSYFLLIHTFIIRLFCLALPYAYVYTNLRLHNVSLTKFIVRVIKLAASDSGIILYFGCLTFLHYTHALDMKKVYQNSNIKGGCFSLIFNVTCMYLKKVC